MNTTRFRHLAMLIAVLPAGAGCADESSKPGGIALEDYRASFQTTFGDKLIECCTDPELAIVLAPDEDTNEPDTATAAWRSLIDAGELAYDPTAAAAHLSSVRDIACPELAAFLRDLNSGDLSFLYAPFEGLIADGQICDSHTACTSGYCAYDAAAGRGECTTKPGVGGECPPACAPGLCCGADLHCADEPASPMGGYCAPKEANGESCLNSYDCASANCAGGDASNAIMGTCAAAPSFCDGK